MNILSLGTPLFSSPWRAAGHRVLVLADIALGGHKVMALRAFYYIVCIVEQYCA